MKILVVSQYYYPEQFRINDICEDLVKRGHEVTVLTGLPNYPSGAIPKEYRYGRKRRQIINGVNVIRTFEIGRGKSKIQLILNYLSYMISGSFKVISLNKDFDVVYVYQLSPIIMGIPALIYKSIARRKIVLYCQDLWPESLKAMNIKENSIMYKLVHGISKFIYKKCDSIVVSSKPFIKYLIDVNKIDSEKLNYIPQHAERLYENLQGKSEDNDCIDFLFAGNIGRVQDIDCILLAVNEIKKIEKFKVHLVGDGSYMDNVKNMVKELGIENRIVLHGRHPVEDMPKFYKMADIFLLTLKGDSVVGLTVPSKLQGYMAAGKPILAAINGAARDIIEDANCGVYVEAGNYIEMAKVMKDFIEGVYDCEKLGKNANWYFKNNFTLECYQNRLIDILEK